MWQDEVLDDLDEAIDYGNSIYGTMSDVENYVSTSENVRYAKSIPTFLPQ